MSDEIGPPRIDAAFLWEATKNLLPYAMLSDKFVRGQYEKMAEAVNEFMADAWHRREKAEALAKFVGKEGEDPYGSAVHGNL